jgi:hypothetical protein
MKGFSAQKNWFWLLLLWMVLGGVSWAKEFRGISGPLVVSENWPECTSLKTWMQDVMRLERLENAPETAQGKAFFQWLRLFNRMATGGMIQAHEGDYGKEQYVLDAHKNLFVYGWGFCDTHSRIAEAAWSEFKHDRNAAQRVITQHEDGGYHTMYRLRLDGRYAAFDARYGYYLVEKDEPGARILDWAEVGVDENILKNQSFQFRSRPFFEFFGREWDRALLLQTRFYNSEEEWIQKGKPVECVFADPKHEMGTLFHDMNFRLPQGSRLERYWDNSARKFYVPAGFESKGEEPFRPSGRFYRVTETMREGNWPKFDPNFAYCAPYLVSVPSREGYNPEVRGGRTIGQAWGKWIYTPDLRDPDLLSNSPIQTDFQLAGSVPFLRPARQTGGGQAIVDFYCPYVMVDGVLEGEWLSTPGDQPGVEIRILHAKPNHEREAEEWSSWQPLGEVPGRFRYELGKPRFNGRDISIHGIYHFQIRLSLKANQERSGPAGLKSLRFTGWFENGIMAIPRIVEGNNTIHFKVADDSAVRGPIQISYRYQTLGGEKEHRQVLRRKDFKNHRALYGFQAPGLIRCNSLIIEY